MDQGAFGWAADDLMVKIANSCWDVGKYALGCRVVIGLLWLNKCGSRIFDCCCSGLDDEEGSAIIHSLVPDSLQFFYPCF